MFKRIKRRLQRPIDNSEPTDSGSRSRAATFSAPHSTNTAGRDNKFTTVAGNLNYLIFNHASDKSILDRLKTSLNPVPTARHDAYESKTEVCFPNTRVQLLKDIEAWITQGDHKASIYVLEGVAGIGKSTVAQTIAVKAVEDQKILVASFFFSRDEDVRMVARRFFPTIAYQLGCYNRQLATQISQALDDDPEAPGKQLYQQFSLLLRRPLQDSKGKKPVLIVVDALDECEEKDATELLSLIGQYGTQISGLKVLITTRPEKHLRRILDQDKNHERFRLQEIENSIVHADIKLYLDSKLSKPAIYNAFPNLRTPWPPSTSDMDILCGICGTLFIIAATAVKFIMDSHSTPQTQLSHLLKGVSPDTFNGSEHTDVLDATYLRIITATQSDRDELDEKWFRSLNRIFGALITLAHPLPSEVLALLLDMDPDHLEAILSSLHSLVAPSGTGANTIFRVHHKSFPDFITNKQRIQRSLGSCKLKTRPGIDNLLWIDVGQNHLHLAKACFRVMNDKLMWNMANINEADWYKDKDDIPHVKPDFIPADLAYAALHWATHLLSIRRVVSDSELQEGFDSWVSTHLMHWIEVMVILDQVYKIYDILQDAITSIKCITGAEWPQREKVQELLSDTSRFVQQGSEVMRVSPMHMYRSCLPFLPTETLLYRTYGSSITLQVGMERSTQWDPWLVACVGHENYVASVVFSTDGSYLASGSWDETIRLWDAKTGAHIQTLTGHSSWVTSVAFSNDDSKLISGSWDNTVRLWDVRTGEHLFTFSGHLEHVLSVAFSSNTSQFLSGSEDTTIRLWDIATETSTATLNGHSAPVNAVAFSTDGLRLVSGSDDNTIRVWDPITRAHILTMTGHSDKVYSVAFSPDGSQVVSGSEDKTVRLWDAMTGAQIYEFVGHSRKVSSVAFSSDGSRLASGSLDASIRLWDAKSGAHLSTLLGHSNAVKSVVFSIDGSRIASAGGDTVGLWDTSSYTCSSSPSNLAGHSGSITSVAFSEDGSRLASGSLDNTVRLWDTKKEICIFALNGHSAQVMSVAFSSDSSRLASGSVDETIQIWDAETGTHIFTLTGHRGILRSVAFSKDGSQLASGSSDNTIRVWNATTGAHLFTLTDHSDIAPSVAFSSNSLRLAYASRNSVQLWDAKTGTPIHALVGHSGWYTVSVTFSTDNSQLASACDKEIRLWDAQTGSLRSTFTGAEFLFPKLISFAFLTCDGGNRPTNHTSLLLLVQREIPRVYGLVKASLRSGNEWEVAPLCWFPPEMVMRSFAFHQATCRVAVGFGNGRVIVIDLSSERSRLS